MRALTQPIAIIIDRGDALREKSHLRGIGIPSSSAERFIGFSVSMYLLTGADAVPPPHDDKSRSTPWCFCDREGREYFVSIVHATPRQRWWTPDCV